MWFVALQPGQEQPCDCFDHADNIVHMGKTIAQKGAQGIRMSMLLLLGISPKLIPQQRKLMGSSAQINSGVCRCGSQEQVPEEGSRRFRRVPVCAGVGSGGRFRRVLVFAGVRSGGNFRRVWRVPVCAGVGSGGNFQKVPESSRVSEGLGVVCGLLPCNLDRNNHVIVFEHLLVIILSTWAKPLGNKNVFI